MFYRRQCRLRPLEYVPNVLLAEEHVLPCANLREYGSQGALVVFPALFFPVLVFLTLALLVTRGTYALFPGFGCFDRDSCHAHCTFGAQDRQSLSRNRVAASCSWSRSSLLFSLVVGFLAFLCC